MMLLSSAEMIFPDSMARFCAETVREHINKQINVRTQCFVIFLLLFLMILITLQRYGVCFCAAITKSRYSAFVICVCFYLLLGILVL